MSPSEKTIAFNLPDRDSPGYLKRQLEISEIQADLRVNPGKASLKRLVAFLLPFVAEPGDPNQAEAMIWDLPQAELERIMLALTGTQVPPKA
jgi:hypothetical protein